MAPHQPSDELPTMRMSTRRFTRRKLSFFSDL
jgi:hypothetical protein